MKLKELVLWLFLACAGVMPTLADSPVDWPTLSYTEVVTNTFEQPTAITHAGDGSGRLFIVEKPGRIRIIQNGNTLPQPFLDIIARTRSDGEQVGLLSLAFSPGFTTNHAFYVSYTRSQGGGQAISRFQLSSDPNIADAGSEQIIKIIPTGSINNGGQLAFGPDGYLYIGVGDNGTDNFLSDTQTNSQNTTTLFGKLLRIDVESGVFPYSIPTNNPFVGNTNYLPEIWAVGLRNPRRFSFDGLTGDLYIGDSGFMKFEEINFQPAGSPGGENYGWKIMEGPTNYHVPLGFTNFSALTLPVTSYEHISSIDGTKGLVIAGHVHRGPGNPRMNGIYFFGDYYGDYIWGLKQVGTNWQTQPLTPSQFLISSFGQDEQGQLYVANRYPGKIYQIQDTHQSWIPEFSPASGILNSNTAIVTCPTPNAVIHYTTNGIDPTESDPIVPPGGIITVGYTNKARAFRPDLSPSPVATAVYGFTVGTPTFTPPGKSPGDPILTQKGGITNNTPITISTKTPGATIYYTTDGTTPTINSLIYSGPLTASPGAELQAIGVADGYTNSSVAIARYSAAKVATPVFSPSPSSSAPPTMTVTNGASISISCATPGAIVYYTLDGSSPTTNSLVYAAPITINSSTKLSAFAVADAYLNSDVESVHYSLAQTPTPVLQITVTDTQAILSWPVSAENFTLETSSTVSSNAVWTPLTNGVTTSVNNFVVTNNIGSSASFYRLHKQ